MLFVVFLALRIGQVCVAAALPRAATSVAVDTPIAAVATVANTATMPHVCVSGGVVDVGGCVYPLLGNVSRISSIACSLCLFT